MASGIADTISQNSESSSSGGSRSKLVQRLLEASADLPEFLNNLITSQAVVIVGTEAAGFLVERTTAPESEEKGAGGEAGGAPEQRIALRPVAHIRPDESDASTRAAAVRAFQNLIIPCVTQNRDGAILVGSPDGGEPQFCLVTLLRNEGQVVAVSAVITRCRDEERAKQRLGSMQLVAGYFDLYVLRRSMDQIYAVAERHQSVLQYASAVSTSDGFESAAMNLCNELANRTSASRVSIGWVKGSRIRVRALSHTEKFDKKQDLIVDLEKVMEECLDQEEPVRFDPQGQSSPNVTRQARQFSQKQGGVAVISMPLRRRDEIEGVLVLEFPPAQQPNALGQEGLAVSAEILAPQLYDRHLNDRNIFVKIGLTLKELAKAAVGPRHMVFKLVTALIVAVVLFITFYKPTYHVGASFILEAQTKRDLCAPYEGLVGLARHKAGEFVKEGEVIAAFRTDDLERKLEPARADMDTKYKTWQTLEPDGTKQADALIAYAQYEAAKSQVDLINYQLATHEIRAPFDCMIQQGDLTEQINTSHRQGDVLFTVAQVVEDRTPANASYDGTLTYVSPDLKSLDTDGLTVTANQVVATLTVADLDSKLATAKNEDASARQYYETLRDHATANQASELIEAEQLWQKTKAEVARLEAQVARYNANGRPRTVDVKAPFDATAYRADWTSPLDAGKEEGDGLFDFVKTGSVRSDQVAVEMEMAVSEKDIQEVMRVWEKQRTDPATAKKEDGRLATTTDPNSTYGFKITRIVPNGEAKEGDNLFKVYGSIQNPPTWATAGQTGEAKINIEPRRVVWIWTHRLVDYVRLKLWI